MENGTLRRAVMGSFAALLLMPVIAVQAVGSGSAPEETLILAEPHDPYYPLAEEVAQQEGLPIAHTLDEALASEPSSLLWVVSPDRLSDEILIAYGLALRDRPSSVSAGMISGATLDDARELWLRATQVKGERLVAANAANPSGHIEPELRALARF